MSQQLQLQLYQITAYAEELSQVGLVPSPFVAKLLVTQQPLPHVMFKSKAIDSPYIVSLITGANQEIESIGPISGTLGAGGLNYKNKASLENAIAQLDSYERKAYFNAVKVNVSSRMTMVHLKFSCTLVAHQQTHAIESSPTFPFIVITHENQWVEAASKLVLMDGFKGLEKVPWPQFANALHSHFLSATRQDLMRPDRPLTHHELRYFNREFLAGSPVINQQQAMRFFQWFGNIERTIRFKRHVHRLWVEGLICGFLSRTQCEKVLSGQGVGLFIIRFSESQPGLFALAFVSEDLRQKIKHYLVKPEDIGTNKALPDFLRDRDALQYILKLNPENARLSRLSKEMALKKYYSKRKLADAKGYVGTL
eukprot:TRINITY_DN8098_c0_g1_i1.p1 TRINITY_DN8098_c0_g1~~TRINITY_DN8098_c0_g1_i1.p1  ORF type:complete len:367 (+),score=35.25 TRINITY_DN8098_c0_g1_i1:101-1201(+)